MASVTLQVKLAIEPGLLDGQSGEDWMRDMIKSDPQLLLHSNGRGTTIGAVTVLEIEETPEEQQSRIDVAMEAILTAHRNKGQ